MKRIAVAVMFLFLVAALPGVAHADLDGLLRKLNEQAKSDIVSFNAKLSKQFGIPVPDINTLIKKVADPADAFMCLQLSMMTQKPPETVVRTYQSNRGKGWGVIAKELGIKPGSPEFHALKRGDFALTGQPAGGVRRGQGHGGGHGKGHGRGQGRGNND